MSNASSDTLQLKLNIRNQLSWQPLFKRESFFQWVKSRPWLLWIHTPSPLSSDITFWFPDTLIRGSKGRKAFPVSHCLAAKRNLGHLGVAPTAVPESPGPTCPSVLFPLQVLDGASATWHSLGGSLQPLELTTLSVYYSLGSKS